MAATTQTTVNIHAADQQATQTILSAAINRTLVLPPQTVYPASNPVLNITPQNVGLVKKFSIVVTATISNTGSTTINLTPGGIANIFGLNGVQYTDLNQYTRVSTSGLHLSLLANAKRRDPLGCTHSTNTDNGNSLSQMLNVSPASWAVFQAPQSIASGQTGTIRAVFELPLAYSDRDLRGAVFANVVSTQQQITLTFNPQAVGATPNDTGYAIYAGGAGSAGNISSATVKVYQHILDQLPTASNGTLILPALSLSTAYELKQTTVTGIAQGQDYYIPYANERSFISTFALYNNDGGSDGCTYGTDVNYWALRAANSTDIWKLDALDAAFFSRERFGTDLQAGMYYFDSRARNIATRNYGNLALVLNTSTAVAGKSYVQCFWEMFAGLNALSSGSSLTSA